MKTKQIRPSRRFFERFGNIDVERAVAVAVIVSRRRRGISVSGSIEQLRAERFPMGRTTAYHYLSAGRWLFDHARVTAP